MRHTRSLLVLALVAAMAVPAAAQSRPGFSIQHFQPKAGGDHIIATEGSEVAPAWSPYGGIWLHYMNAPLRRAAADGSGEQQVLRGLFAGQVAAGIGLFDFAELEVALPVVFASDGDATQLAGLDEGSVGDVALRLRARILSRADFAGFGLTAGLAFTVPTGSPEAANGEPGATFQPKLAATYGYRGFLAALNVGLNLRTDTRPYDNLTLGHELTWAVGARYGFNDLVAVKAEVAGRTPLTRPIANATDTPVEVLGGPELTFADAVRIDAGVGVGAVPGYGTPDVRGFVGLQWTGARAEAEEEPPPPDIVSDLDGDGFSDNIDGCPTLAEDFDGFEDDDGCPDSDDDGDGIDDVHDRCPRRPETVNGCQDDDGCPDDPDLCEVRVTCDAIIPAGEIHFDTDKTSLTTRDVAITQANFHLLFAVARAMHDNPWIARVEVVGHADHRGTDAHNLLLSARRAVSVVTQLGALDVASERLAARHHGENRPKVQGSSPEALQANRRVAFRITELGDDAPKRCRPSP